MVRKIRHLTVDMVTPDLSTVTVQQLNRSCTKKLYYTKRKLKDMDIGIVSANTKDTSNAFLMNETNLHAVFSTYYLGTCPVDIENALFFLAIPGVHNFCGLLYNNIEVVNAKIIEVCAKIEVEGLVEETKATIKKKLGDTYSDDKLNTFTNSFFLNKGGIPEDIKIIAIITSFDMGWNQCAT